MTVVAAASWGGQTWIASDSAGTDGWGLQAHYGSKLALFPFGVLGFSASYRTLQAIHGELYKIQRIANDDDAKRLVAVIEKALMDAGWNRSTTGAMPKCEDLAFLVATSRGRLYTVHSDLALLRHERFAAIGSGYQVASGALGLAWRTGLRSREALRLAMRTTLDSMATCGGRVYMRNAKAGGATP